jgi:hypothetical protein
MRFLLKSFFNDLSSKKLLVIFPAGFMLSLTLFTTILNTPLYLIIRNKKTTDGAGYNVTICLYLLYKKIKEKNNV